MDSFFCRLSRILCVTCKAILYKTAFSLRESLTRDGEGRRKRGKGEGEGNERWIKKVINYARDTNLSGIHL